MTLTLTQTLILILTLSLTLALNLALTAKYSATRMSTEDEENEFYLERVLSEEQIENSVVVRLSVLPVRVCH